jgi:hypothetical protein
MTPRYFMCAGGCRACRIPCSICFSSPLLPLQVPTQLAIYSVFLANSIKCQPYHQVPRNSGLGPASIVAPQALRNWIRPILHDHSIPSLSDRCRVTYPLLPQQAWATGLHYTSKAGVKNCVGCGDASAFIVKTVKPARLHHDEPRL